MICCVFYNILIIFVHIFSNLFRRHYFSVLKLFLKLLLFFWTHLCHYCSLHILH
nr:MAG TPA: hypothetical protein [Bacteriophage sp.]